MTLEQGACTVAIVSKRPAKFWIYPDVIYSEIFFRLSENRKSYLLLLQRRKMKAITSGNFIKKYRLTSASLI